MTERERDWLAVLLDGFLVIVIGLCVILAWLYVFRGCLRDGGVF